MKNVCCPNIIYEDSEFLIIHILTYEGARYFGQDTEWCISKDSVNDKSGSYYFDLYLKNEYSGFYFVINKSTNKKWCLCTKKSNPNELKEIWNAENDTVDGVPNLPDIPGIGYTKNWNSFDVDDNF